MGDEFDGSQLFVCAERLEEPSPNFFLEGRAAGKPTPGPSLWEGSKKNGPGLLRGRGHSLVF
jgi:hypothetical protein